MRPFRWSTAPDDATPAQKRNFLAVQIDGVGIGLAGAAAPFLPVFLTRLGATNFQVGLLTAMPAFTGLILALLIGRFLQSRRQVVPWYGGMRFLVVMSYALTGIVPFIVPRDYAVPAVLLIWAVATLPQTFVSVAFSVVMNAVAGPKGRYDLMSRRWTILGLTTSVAVAITGEVLDRINFPLNYQLVFMGLSLGGLLSYAYSRRIDLPDAEPPPRQSGLSASQRFKNFIALIRGERQFVSFTASALFTFPAHHSPRRSFRSILCACCTPPMRGSGSSTPHRRPSCWWGTRSGRASGGCAARALCCCGRRWA